jgi:hypothetical protein
MKNSDDKRQAQYHEQEHMNILLSEKRKVFNKESEGDQNNRRGQTDKDIVKKHENDKEKHGFLPLFFLDGIKIPLLILDAAHQSHHI